MCQAATPRGARHAAGKRSDATAETRTVLGVIHLESKDPDAPERLEALEAWVRT